jgi:transposase
MSIPPDAAPLDHIIELANGIIDECPSCAGTASEIVMWANEIRERRPGREELAALVDATCSGLPADQRAQLIDGLRAFVRFAET